MIKFILSFLIIGNMFVNSILGQTTILTTKGGLGSKIKITSFKSPEKSKFERTFSLDDSNYEVIKTKYEGKDAEGQHYWSFIETAQKTTETITQINGGGLKLTFTVDKKTKGEFIFGTLTTYTYKNEILTLVTTGKGAIIHYENPDDLGSMGDMTIENTEEFNKNLKSKKDFKVVATKFLELDENNITLSFQKNNTEIDWNEKGNSKIFQLKK